MVEWQEGQEGQEEGLNVPEAQPLGLRVALQVGDELLLMLTLRVALLQGLEEGL